MDRGTGRTTERLLAAIYFSYSTKSDAVFICADQPAHYFQEAVKIAMGLGLAIALNASRDTFTNLRGGSVAVVTIGRLDRFRQGRRDREFFDHRALGEL